MRRKVCTAETTKGKSFPFLSPKDHKHHTFRTHNNFLTINHWSWRADVLIWGISKEGILLVVKQVTCTHAHTHAHAVCPVYRLSFLFQTRLVAQLPAVRQLCYLASKAGCRRNLSATCLIRTNRVFTLKVLHAAFIWVQPDRATAAFLHAWRNVLMTCKVMYDQVRTEVCNFELQHCIIRLDRLCFWLSVCVSSHGALLLCRSDKLSVTLCLEIWIQGN